MTYSYLGAWDLVCAELSRRIQSSDAGSNLVRGKMLAAVLPCMVSKIGSVW